MHQAPKSSLPEGLNNWPVFPSEKKRWGQFTVQYFFSLCSVSVLKIVVTKNLNKEPDFLSIIHSVIQQVIIDYSPSSHETQSSRGDRYLKSKCKSVLASRGTSYAELCGEDRWGWDLRLRNKGQGSSSWRALKVKRSDLFFLFGFEFIYFF